MGGMGRPPNSASFAAICALVICGCEAHMAISITLRKHVGILACGGEKPGHDWIRRRTGNASAGAFISAIRARSAAICLR
ncbi:MULTISPECIES: hypothetical protein [unclassified Mesorhizobium]|uniref:hypothetical protein n=1 Tax=unclassified Mesorhizobium TaxID=325217 RepID=UPI002415DBB5|nr:MULTISPECIES: hypothetical protein [unclassified Mesorhizobium]MDG4891524.1 hypothetical protein [Mesorhizobium sp. WSM4887]MDG4899425.1 hypothetical protein [Mesorhizobium sp. WSM4962]MDG4918338.1 hypothetical protein [Mesorhizobium sp. WSM4989]